jgi:hypothetical protein
MKKFAYILISLMAFATIANAQIFQYGIKGGVNSSKINIDKTTITNISTTTPGELTNLIIEQGDSKLGLHFGGFARIQLAGLFIQPELLFTQTNAEFVITEQDPDDLESTVESLANQKFNKFDIPVIVGWKFGPARVGLGPVATIMLSEKNGLQDRITSITGDAVENNLKNAVFGFQVGAGLDLFKFATLDVRYEGNLSKLGESVKIGNSDYALDQRNPQWIFSLGIFF